MRGKKPFKCDICSKDFAENGNLKRHFTSVHEGEKPHKCDICDANFTQKSKLQAHITSVHEEIKSRWFHRENILP